MSSNQNLFSRVSAVIFDMDGLMLDTERVERVTFQRAAADFGFHSLEEPYVRTIGRNWPDSKRIFAEALGDQFPYDEIRKRWRQYTETYIAESGVSEKPGLRELLEFLEKVDVPKAVATSTIRVKALALLQQSNLLHHFGAVVGGDEVSAGKPDPAIFLAAAKRLNVEPQRCLVLEDSGPGIQAAHAAGMISVLVPDTVQPTAETLARAFCVCRSLSGVIELLR
jgi:HAD superfamily hydrolase (TIGR01509 family)